MTDYLGNEIHIGDTILFSGRNSRGYRASFDECVVTEFKGNTKVKVNNPPYGWSDWRMNDNVINLTALGLRSRQEVTSDEIE